MRFQSSRSIAAALGGLLLLALCSLPASALQSPDYELALVDMKGNRTVLGPLPNSVFAPRVSPDGKQVAFELADDSPADGSGPVRVYVAALAQLAQRRPLPMVGTGRNWAPVWFGDGQRLVFLVSGSEPDALYVRRADGTGEAERLIEARSAEGFTADGAQLAFITRTGNRDYGISMLDLTTKVTKTLVDIPDSEQHSSRISPDGRWLAYASTETGRQELWMEPLPQTGKRYRVTQTGGRHPLFSPDGSHLYFDQGGQMFQIELFLGAEAPKTGAPKALPIRGFQQGDLRRQFDLMPDGRHFLMLFPRA